LTHETSGFPLILRAMLFSCNEAVYITSSFSLHLYLSRSNIKKKPLESMLNHEYTARSLLSECLRKTYLDLRSEMLLSIFFVRRSARRPFAWCYRTAETRWFRYCYPNRPKKPIVWREMIPTYYSWTWDPRHFPQQISCCFEKLELICQCCCCNNVINIRIVAVTKMSDFLTSWRKNIHFPGMLRTGGQSWLFKQMTIHFFPQ